MSFIQDYKSSLAAKQDTNQKMGKNSIEKGDVQRMNLAQRNMSFLFGERSNSQKVRYSIYVDVACTHSTRISPFQKAFRVDSRHRELSVGATWEKRVGLKLNPQDRWREVVKRKKRSRRGERRFAESVDATSKRDSGKEVIDFIVGVVVVVVAEIVVEVIVEGIVDLNGENGILMMVEPFIQLELPHHTYIVMSHLITPLTTSGAGLERSDRDQLDQLLAVIGLWLEGRRVLLVEHGVRPLMLHDAYFGFPVVVAYLIPVPEICH
ncbi:hypothetical protein Sjap_015620 [Stephania japonica]|uniref:Uncharacterized protein n=1 Tax=Stephania japonica TaxID=461633 RepID=A0AAP0IKJ7_9MAGN